MLWWNFSAGLLDLLTDPLVHRLLFKLVFLGGKTVENSYSTMVMTSLCNFSFKLFFIYKNLKIIILVGVVGIQIRFVNLVFPLAFVKNMPFSPGNEISCSLFILDIDLKYWMQKVSHAPYYYFLLIISHRLLKMCPSSNYS